MAVQKDLGAARGRSVSGTHCPLAAGEDAYVDDGSSASENGLTVSDDLAHLD
jgi:hypothetical protein